MITVAITNLILPKSGYAIAMQQALSVSISSNWVATYGDRIVLRSNISVTSIGVIVVSEAIVVVTSVLVAAVPAAVATIVRICEAIPIAVTISVTVVAIDSIAIAEVANANAGSVSSNLDLYPSELGLC